jgi:hypothetical protein
LLSSGLSSRLALADLENLISLYRAVEGANFLSGLVPMHVQTASLSSDDVVRQVFEEEAERLATAPFMALPALATEAATSVRRLAGTA